MTNQPTPHNIRRVCLCSTDCACSPAPGGSRHRPGLPSSLHCHPTPRPSAPVLPASSSDRARSPHPLQHRRLWVCPRADSHPDTMSRSAPPGTRGHPPAADPGRRPRPFLFLPPTARPLPRSAQAPPRRSPPPHPPFRRRPHPSPQPPCGQVRGSLARAGKHRSAK